MAEHPSPRSRDLTWLGFLCLALLLPLGVRFLDLADKAKPDDWTDNRLTYIPSGKFLKPMVLDQDAVVADVLWIRAMIYFADSYLQGKPSPWLAHILDVVTVLNPRFKTAYEFAGTVLTRPKGDVSKALKLLDRGIGEFPQSWQLRVYAALAQLTLDSNYVKASEYLQPIALEPGVPNHIRTLSATLLDRGGGRRMALAFLVNSWLATDNTINREIFLEKILKMYSAAPGADAAHRKRTVEAALRQAEANPALELVALGVIHEFLSGETSSQTQRLIERLGR